MLPPHLPANRKVSSHSAVNRPVPAATGERSSKARRIGVKGELRIQGKRKPMMVMKSRETTG
jgi:hypothetical protein